MPTAIVIPLLVVLWAAVLSPILLRKYREYKMDVSIQSFHDSLHHLDRTGDQVVTDDDWMGHTEVPLLPPRRPQLVLLRPVADDNSASDDPYVDEDSGQCYERVPVMRKEESFITDEPLDFGAPQVDARARRRRVVLALAAAGVACGLAGFVPALGFLWIVSGLAWALLAAFVAAAFVMVKDAGSTPVRVRSRQDSRRDQFFEEEESFYNGDLAVEFAYYNPANPLFDEPEVDADYEYPAAVAR